MPSVFIDSFTLVAYLESSIVQKVQALRGLSGKIEEIVHYLRDVK
jgi:hypothetical protein